MTWRAVSARPSYKEFFDVDVEYSEVDASKRGRACQISLAMP